MFGKCWFKIYETRNITLIFINLEIDKEIFFKVISRKVLSIKNDYVLNFFFNEV